MPNIGIWYTVFCMCNALLSEFERSGSIRINSEKEYVAYLNLIGWFCVCYHLVTKFPGSVLILAVGCIFMYLDFQRCFWACFCSPYCLVPLRCRFRGGEMKLLPYCHGKTVKFVATPEVIQRYSSETAFHCAVFSRPINHCRSWDTCHKNCPVKSIMAILP